MRELGVDADRLRAVNDEFASDLMASIGATGPSQGGPEPAPDAAAFGPTTDVFADVPPVIGPGTGGVTDDGWSHRTRPFDGWSWAYSMSWRGGNDPLMFMHDGTYGLIGMHFFWENADAGDDDSMDMWSDGNVGFWYYAPREGHIEVQARFGTRRVPQRPYRVGGRMGLVRCEGLAVERRVRQRHAARLWLSQVHYVERPDRWQSRLVYLLRRERPQLRLRPGHAGSRPRAGVGLGRRRDIQLDGHRGERRVGGRVDDCDVGRERGAGQDGVTRA